MQDTDHLAVRARIDAIAVVWSAPRGAAQTQLNERTKDTSSGCTQ
jgi:hypothetical protein